MTQRFIPKHGGYHKLLTFKRSEIIYDATIYFTKRCYLKGDRTIDQMVQAARSGKQNIVEASLASGTSKEMEIKLTNVARSSQGELLIDYQDFLRIRNLQEWTKDHPYTKSVTDLCKGNAVSYETFKKGIENKSLEISTNVIICLIKLTMFLLSKQIQRLEQDFLKEGGLRERMTHARLASRRQTPF